MVFTCVMMIVVFTTACGILPFFNGTSSPGTVTTAETLDLESTPETERPRRSRSEPATETAPTDLPETCASEFSYRFDAEINGIIIDRYNGTALRVHIPSYIEGFPVTVIGERAFAQSGIAYIFIPNSVTTIADYAFFHCTGLASIILPSSLTTIGARAFNGTNLTSITLPDSLVSIGDSAFANTALTSLTIPHSVQNLCFNALRGLENIEVNRGVQIPDSSVRVGDIVNFGLNRWYVLDIQNDKLLLISENVIKNSFFHDPNNRPIEYQWEHSVIRTYLNEELYYTFFISAERERIIETRNINPCHPRIIIPGGNDTMDRIFLLNIDEAQYYFSSDAERATGEPWWIRTSSQNVFYVTSDGNIWQMGNFNPDIGVRPALWMSLHQ